MAERASQDIIEVLLSDSSSIVRVSQHVVEVLLTHPTASPTSPTGAGVSQAVIEVLLSDATSTMFVSQYCQEVLVEDGDWTWQPVGGEGGGIHVYGWSG